MTPREMAAWIAADRKLERLDHAANLWLGTLAAQGDPKENQKLIGRLSKDG